MNELPANHAKGREMKQLEVWSDLYGGSQRDHWSAPLVVQEKGCGLFEPVRDLLGVQVM